MAGKAGANDLQCETSKLGPVCKPMLVQELLASGLKTSLSVCLLLIYFFIPKEAVQEAKACSEETIWFG